MNAPATNADVIAAALKAEGIEYAFGLPGGEVVVLIDALRRAGIKFFLVGHEASAAFMADVTGQITGRAGVCVSTLGPGATNLVSGVANAFLERSPLLALTAQISSELYPSFTHQRLPLDRLFGGITKRSAVLDGSDVGAEVAAALHLARSDRPGPVHLAIPSDVAAGEPRSAVRPVATTDPPGAGGGSGGTSGGGVATQADQVLLAIQQARRPLALIGLGARPADAPAIRHLLETAQWPWVSTPKAKGIVPESHPRFLGVASGMAIDRVILDTIEASDLLVGIGFDPVECEKPWFLERPIVNLMRWSTREGSYRPVEAVGDIGVIASDLAARLASQPWPETLLEERRRAIARHPRTSVGAEDSPSAGLSPLAVLQSLRDVLPEDAVVACDVGSHKLLAGQFWRTTMPHTFFMSNGLSSMGYGLPAAMAASLHFPNRSVAALVGDGGMLMMSHNLPLIAALKLPILTVVLTDGSLSLIRFAQTRRHLPPYGTDFAAPDFTHFAAACGIPAARATTLEAVKLHASRAIATRAPFLLDIAIDLREYEELI